MLCIASLLLGILTVAHAYNQPTCADDRTTIVHLFMWKWNDIALECERFLGPKGFCGVQVSPPQEHRIVTSPNRPWWERYQPVSYKLESSSGGRAAFIDMVERCNNVGVRIYVDMVVNHMVGFDGGEGTGTGGSYFNTGSLSFPGVPYGSNDFNPCSPCPSSCNIENYGDVNQVRNCRLVALVDLKLGSEYVRDMVAGYFNDLIDIGVAGFRVDAAKHMWPDDMSAIYSRMNNLNTRWFNPGTVPYIFNEVIDLGGEAISATEYTHLGDITEFSYSADIGNRFRGNTELKWLKDMGEAWGWLPSDNALVFVDNHDNQRGHGAGGSSVLTHTFPRAYKMATAFTLAQDYGEVRIMSSYEWNNIDWLGPPSHGDGSIKDVPINPDGTCGDGWLCEHRWRQITNMAKFRNVVKGTISHNWWDNGNNQIAFSRGNKGFIAINNDFSALSASLQTGMPEGVYCDVISGDLVDGSCTGDSVTVFGDGTANIYIDNSAEDPYIAIHAESRVGSGGGATSPPIGTTTTRPPPTGLTRTVVLLYLQTQVGQDVFLRGGISHSQRPGCTETAATSACAITIDHEDIGTGSHYEKYNAWRAGDNHLDWYGNEGGQGSYLGTTAGGTPTAWTTNEVGQPGYQPVNTFGQHHWLLDVYMDCSDTENGWFELKGFVPTLSTNGGWEGDISQSVSCTGTAGGMTPYVSTNHMARCGYVNVFSWNSNGCVINNF